MSSQKPTVDEVEPLTESEIALIQKRYQNASASEKKFFDDIFSHVRDPNVLVHLFRGAHIEFNDQGKAYKDWCTNLSNLTDRSGKGQSSHQSDVPQKSLQGDLVVECLFGARKIRGETHTWFQLESHGLGVTQVLGHAASFIAYKWTGKNQGPYGASPHTEANPLILTYTNSNQRQKQQKNLWNKIMFEQPAKITQQILAEYANIHASEGYLPFAQESKKLQERFEKESRKSEQKEEHKEEQKEDSRKKPDLS